MHRQAGTREDGTIEQIVGANAGSRTPCALKKKVVLTVTSEKVEGKERVYRLA